MLTSRLLVQAVATLTNPLDLAAGSVPLTFNHRVGLDNGTGADQADSIFHDRRTLAASATEDLDLAGTLVDAFGQTLTFARIKGLIVAADTANVDSVLVGGAATNGWASWVGDPTDVVVVRPGGALALAAPDATAYPVTASTADLLHIANASGATAATYDVILIGASA